MGDAPEACPGVGCTVGEAVFIGGVAVYLHSRHAPELAPESTHDIVE